jgi:hypothetical protein
MAAGYGVTSRSTGAGSEASVAGDEEITSIKDPRVAEARELTSATGRRRLGKILLEGTESVRWALAAGLRVDHIFYTPAKAGDELLAPLRAADVPCYGASDGIRKKIGGTSYVVPFIAVAQMPQPSTDHMGDLVVVLDGVRDHGNIGTIVRTASAFGVRDLVLTAPDLDLFYRKIVDASRGTVFAARLHRYASGADAIPICGGAATRSSPPARTLGSSSPRHRSRRSRSRWWWATSPRASRMKSCGRPTCWCRSP